MNVRGGTASGTVISGGGINVVFSRGTSVDDLLIGAGQGVSAIEIVSSGSIASHTVLSNTGQLFVQAGGSAVNTVINNVRGFTVGSNGGLIVNSGGVVFGATVNSNGGLNVKSGGVDSGAIIHGDGSAFVSVGGKTFNDVLIGNGPGHSAFEFLLSTGATASGATLSNTGVLIVSSGGLAVGTVVTSTSLGSTGSNGALVLSSGGVGTGQRCLADSRQYEAVSTAARLFMTAEASPFQQGSHCPPSSPRAAPWPFCLALAWHRVAWPVALASRAVARRSYPWVAPRATPRCGEAAGQLLGGGQVAGVPIAAAGGTV